MRINSSVNNDITLLDLLLKKKHYGKKNQTKAPLQEMDLLTESIESIGKSDCYSKSSSPNILSKPGLAELEWLNFNFKGCSGNIGTLIRDGKEYAIKDLPDVEPSWCKEIKVINGVVNLESGQYYKYTSEDGSIYTFASSQNHFGQPLSEQLKSRQDEGAIKVAKFWNILASNTLNNTEFHGISFDEQKKYLESAGINKNSFFTIKVGERENTYFFSESMNVGICVPKSQYDSSYNFFAQNGGLKDYPVGSKIYIDNVEYTVSPHHNVDVPYGADIFNIKMPSLDENYDWKKDPLTAKEDL
ncbi:MAG: hypothetical protein E7275_09810 [Pseudobutyrivibrio sp.]|jgi:hypothetical protein|uniref:hypothetical protein n=1 Tax=Pseudobutyrivibrio sp. TaxID=2014367 RepID=UPI0025F6A7B6|nr:hypothetical protein [Pseudobutyrivibrio sp.]MBE5904562.1 hypothetical protein [Pseudobutyrivibrio sp.]